MIIECKSQEEWLEKRVIGGSTASAILGANPYLSNVECYEILTGKKTQKTIDDKECVKYGKKAEDLIRQLFALDYEKELEVIKPRTIEEDGVIDIYYDEEHPYMTATVDGLLIDKTTGEKGIYEGKTTEIMNASMSEKWKAAIPQNYFIQCLHYLLVLGEEYKFVILHCQFKYRNANDLWTIRRSYLIRRKDVEQDLKLLKEKEIDFWENHVAKNKRPNKEIDF